MKIEFINGAVITNIPKIVQDKIINLLFDDAPAAATPPVEKKYVAHKRVKKAKPVSIAYGQRGSEDPDEDKSKRGISDQEQTNIIELYSRGELVTNIAKKFNKTPTAMYQIIFKLKKQGLIKPRQE